MLGLFGCDSGDPDSDDNGVADKELRVVALNDKPGPVEIVVRCSDASAIVVADTTLAWDANNNTFSAKSFTIPHQTRTIRLTFIHDAFDGPDDRDRNAFIDFLAVDGARYEAEDFDRTDGPDPAFPGCAKRAYATASNDAVADCGNEGDWVEYDL